MAISLSSPLPYRALSLGGSPRGLHAILDLEDWWEALQWTWGVRSSWKNKTPKHYAGRSIKPAGKHLTIWLHKWVCERAYGPPPSPAHRIGDHRNGNSLDCRRSNLRWATPSMNTRNKFGIEYLQLSLEV